MKKILSAVVFSLIASVAIGQVDTILPPYKKFPTLPPLNLLLGDSVTVFTKASLPHKKKVVIMFFSPECSHCQHEAQEIVSHKEELKDIQYVMATILPLWEMNQFAKTYGLDSMKNVVLGRDIYGTMLSFYDIRNFPYHALYDKKGKLVHAADGSMDPNKVLELFKGH